jgi:hypothetical protein
LLTDGVYTTIDVPGATTTIPQGINDSGDIVGQYDVSGGVRVVGASRSCRRVKVL